ncbi:MAG: CooT family nickel-binding protein [Candidatus Bathyarchaeia archaeon]
MLPEERVMCEFTVFLKGETVFKDVIYVKADGNRVVVRDVLGASKTFENARVAEIDVSTEKLVLEPLKPK